MLEVIKVLACICIGFYTYRYMKVKKTQQVTKFLFWLIFIRFVAASFHSITYLQIAGPISIISLVSMGSVGTCTLYLINLNRRVIFNKEFILIKLIICLMLLSGFLNSNLMLSISSVLKWGYLLLLIYLLQESFKYSSVNQTLKILLIAYSYPVLLLISSVILGVKKATELDGSLSYLGGYYHESIFSNMIFGAMLVLLLFLIFPKRYSIYKIFLGLIISFFFIILVNYRTTVIAAGIVVISSLYAQYRSQEIQFKVVTFAGVFLMILFATLFDFSSVIDRFIEIPNALKKSSVFISFPEYYSIEDKKFFSGRIYLWSQYISQALEGSEIQYWFGSGMDSWKSYFKLYAHNTIVSFYYELGLLGLLLVCLLFFIEFIKILKIQENQMKWTLIGIYLSFMVLNLGTMPLWQIEGVIMYGLIIALTSHFSGVNNGIK